MEKDESAVSRKWKVIHHLRSIEKVPNPKHPFDPLNVDPGEIFFVYNGKVHCDTIDLTDEELLFIWGEIKKLGFEPKWFREK